MRILVIDVGGNNVKLRHPGSARSSRSHPVPTHRGAHGAAP